MKVYSSLKLKIKVFEYLNASILLHSLEENSITLSDNAEIVAKKSRLELLHYGVGICKYRRVNYK